MDITLIVDPVVGMMVQYAQDQGKALMAAGGAAAAGAVKTLFEKVMAKIKGKFQQTAENFPKKPEGYKAPLADALEETLKADPKFAAELKALLDDCQKKLEAAGTSYSATLTGSGAIAQGNGAVAAGKGGVAVGGNVSGGINSGKGRV